MKIDIVPNESGFTDYYILEVSWDGTSVKNVTRPKGNL